MAYIVLLTLLLLPIVQAQITLSPCPQDAYFDTTDLHCTSCPATTQPNTVPSSAVSCVCSRGYISTATPGVCSSCLASGQSASTDYATCLPCPSGLNLAIGDCACPYTHRIVQIDSGSGPTKMCVACGQAAHVSPSNPYSCVFCSDSSMDNNCTCPQNTTQQGSKCLSSSAVRALTDEFGASATFISFNDIKESAADTQFSSFVFVFHLIESAVLCQQALPDVPSCQTLANLCVLQLYHMSTAACTLFSRYYSQRAPSQTLFPDWHKFMPWLYYSADPRTTLKATNIKMQVAFQSSGTGTTEPVSRLTFYLAAYSLNGTYLGLELLVNQLEMCPQTSNYASQSTKPDFLSFGTYFENNCDFDTQVLLDNQTREPVFYDMYVRDVRDDSLFPVPVRVRNFQNNGGVRVNANANDHADADVVDDVLTRRFFVYDTWSGRSSLGTLQVVRWASHITLDIVSQKDVHDHIYPPVLNILYEERQVTTIVAAAEAGNSFVRTSFITFYSHSLSSFWHTSLILLIVCMVLALCMWIYRVFTWMRRNYNPILNFTLLTNAFILVLDTASDFLFWLCFALCGYWFVFYKGQQKVTVLVPLESEIKNFVAIISVAFVGKAVAVLAMIYKQTNADIFFIDWEKPRGKLQIANTNSANTATRTTSAPVSVWRLFFVANEWNELQSRQCISTTLTLVLLFFLLQGVDLEYMAKSTPATNLAQGPLNTILRFAVTSFFWLLISLVQALYVHIFHQRYINDPIGQFVDLLSVSNVSLFILIDRCHGFYVHGRSVHPYADTHMMELNANLKKEEENLCSTRGLLPNSQQQIFEIYITHTLRSQYESIYLYLIAEDAVARRMNQGAPTNPKVPGPNAMPLLPTTHQAARGKVVAKKLIKAHAIVNKFLSSFVDHSLQDHGYHVLDPSTGGICNRILRAPPDMSQSTQSIFYPASLPALTSTLFYGQEYTLLIFSILLYSVVDVAGGNTPTAILVTFLVHCAVSLVRATLGQRNIANKTLVDSRFLL